MSTRFSHQARKCNVWWVNIRQRALTVAGGATCLFYIRNLDWLRKVYIGEIILSGTQSAEWLYWRRVTAGVTEGTLANFSLIENACEEHEGVNGPFGPCNVVAKFGNDGQDRAGGNFGEVLTTRSFETVRKLVDGAISLHEGDTFAISCTPQVNGDFAISVGFWQMQDPAFTGL